MNRSFLIALALAAAVYFSRIQKNARVVAFVERLDQLRLVAEVKCFLLFVTVRYCECLGWWVVYALISRSQLFMSESRLFVFGFTGTNAISI